MKITITKCFCDVCKKETEQLTEVVYPVIFHTEQTEGRACSPYISKEKIELCEECERKVLVLHGFGAQGINSYSIAEPPKGE